MDQLGPRHKEYKIAALASCRIKLNVKPPTGTELPTVRIIRNLHSVAASVSCEEQNAGLTPLNLVK